MSWEWGTREAGVDRSDAVLTLTSTQKMTIQPEMCYHAASERARSSYCNYGNNNYPPPNTEPRPPYP